MGEIPYEGIKSLFFFHLSFFLFLFLILSSCVYFLSFRWTKNYTMDFMVSWNTGAESEKVLHLMLQSDTEINRGNFQWISTRFNTQLTKTCIEMALKRERERDTSRKKIHTEETSAKSHPCLFFFFFLFRL